MTMNNRTRLAAGLLLVVALGAVAGLGLSRAQTLFPLGPPGEGSPTELIASPTQTRDIEREIEPTIDIRDIHEPLPCYEGMYEGWPAEDIAADVINLYQGLGYIVGEPTIHRLVDIYPADAEPFGLTPEDIFWGCVPDLAIVLEGEFHWREMGAIREEPYVLLLVDRRVGLQSRYHRWDLQTLLDMLPPP